MINILRKLAYIFVRKLKSIYINLKFFYQLAFPIGKKVYFIGTPEYSNIGDSAIAIAQMLFLEKCGYTKYNIKEITQDEFLNYSNCIRRYISNNYLICGIGGGNMGNQWYNEELFRYKLLSLFPKNPIIIFPQTIYFTNDNDGKIALSKSINYYNQHINLTIVAREKKSYEMMMDYYPDASILLVPDIVLFSNMADYDIVGCERKNILLVFRTDAERLLTDKQKNELLNVIGSFKYSYSETDMNIDDIVTKENRLSCVKNKMNEFVSAKLVITDRLHGMIFSAITGTPCIVLSNYNHKVKGTYNWISDLPYIKYAEDIEQVQNYIPELININNNKYANTNLMPFYDELAEVVKKYV